MPLSIRNPRGTRPSKLDLERFRVELLYRQSFTTQLAALSSVLVYAVVTSTMMKSPYLVGWCVAAFVLFALRSGLHRHFKKNVLTQWKFDPFAWERIYCIGVILSGLHWGFAGAFLVSDANIVHEAFFGFILAGCSAGAAVAYCASLMNVLAFILPSISLFGVHLALTGSFLNNAMLGLLALYVAFLVKLITNINAYVVEGLKLRLENEELAGGLKEAQDRLVESEKMAALGRMAGGVAHEISSPLAVLPLQIESLRLTWGKPNPAVNVLEEIAAKMEGIVIRIGKIMMGLRAVALQKGGEEMAIVPVKRIFEETIEFCRMRFKVQGIELRVLPVPDGLAWNCRAVEIGQVLMNLLNNAFDAVKDKENAWVEIAAICKGTKILVTVTDSGNGVPLEIREKIMEPFFTTKAVGDGMGLGLSIAHGFVKAHGGTLEVDQTCANTRFVVTLENANLSLARAA
jgi:signal transduction histidine kinase